MLISLFAYAGQISLTWLSWHTEEKAASNNSPFKIIYEFPWPLSASNLAERANGKILISTQGGPNLYEIDPFHVQRGRVVHYFETHQNTFGSVELEPDVFYVLTANYTHAPTWTGIQGSNALYRVDLNGERPNVTKTFNIDEAYTLDGMTVINAAKGLLLSGDTQTGTLWQLDVKHHKYSAVYQSPLLNQTAEHPDVQLDRVGVNGIRLYNDVVYYADTSRKTFGLLPFDVDTGRPTGEAADIAHFEHHPDDFDISPDGIAVVTLLEQGLCFLDVSGRKRRHGFQKAPRHFLGANAVQFGRTEASRCTLYVLYNRGIVDGEHHSSGLASLDITGLGLKHDC